MTFAVLTRVKVRPGSIDALAEPFDSTNRDLVAGRDDWLGAWFTANRAESEITVIAHWREAGSYEELRNSPEFQSTMAQFAEEFTGPPVVSINEILVEM
jgi:quinol monooxygenase YgiN